jgi:hypothetical protein
VGVVSRYLEEEGIATSQISLVREHTQAIRPPRALWVPFIMGRPLGAPNDALFQRTVLLAALRLLEAPSGPLLQDFDLEAPQSDDALQPGAACPVHFSRPPSIAGVADALGRRLEQEIAQLRPWHDLAVERRSSSTSGISGLSVEEAAAFVLTFAGGTPPVNYRPKQALGLSLKQACDDLRAFYEEAAGAQPGGLSAQAMEEWFYLSTVMGEVLARLWGQRRDSRDESVRITIERLLIPRAVQQRLRSEGE